MAFRDTLAPMSNNTIGAKGFHHVALNVRDFDASITFYRDGLGFPITREWKSDETGFRGAMLDTGDSSYLELFEEPDYRCGAGRIIHFAIRVDSVQTAHNTAMKAGAREKVAPKEIVIPSDPPFPVTISFVFGPDDEEIEFFAERG